MKRVTMFAVALTALSSLACGAGDTAAPGTPADEAATIAAEIRKDPTKQAEVLKSHGMDESEWNARLYEIAKDPAASAAYAAALK